MNDELQNIEINNEDSVNKKIRKKKFADLWSHLGSNQGPPDYESGALTN